MIALSCNIWKQNDIFTEPEPLAISDEIIYYYWAFSLYWFDIAQEAYPENWVHSLYVWVSYLPTRDLYVRWEVSEYIL